MTRGNFVSGLLAGTTAAVIWMAIALWQGVEASSVGMWALIILIVTTVVAVIIASVVGRGATASRT